MQNARNFTTTCNARFSGTFDLGVNMEACTGCRIFIRSVLISIHMKLQRLSVLFHEKLAATVVFLLEQLIRFETKDLFTLQKNDLIAGQKSTCHKLYFVR